MPVDVLVNNVGIFEVADFFKVPDSTWHHYIEANFFSTLRLSRHWIQTMLKRNKVCDMSAVERHPLYLTPNIVFDPHL